MADNPRKEARQDRRKKFKMMKKRIGFVKAAGRMLEEGRSDRAGFRRVKKAAKTLEAAKKMGDKEKGKAPKKEKRAYRDTRETRLKDAAKKTKNQGFVKWTKEERKAQKESGIDAGRGRESVKQVPTAGAKRAKRVLDRMDAREQRKIKRGQEKKIRQGHRSGAKIGAMTKSRESYKKKMRKQGIDVDKKVRGLREQK